MINPANLFDGQSAAIVFGGTALATLMRCGLRDCRIMFSAIAGLCKPRFDAAHVRSELALQVQDIARHGFFRAKPHETGDREFDEATATLIERRSVPALLAAHERHKVARLAHANTAVRGLAQAAELAPVFGLAGTLVSLSQLPAEGIARGSFTGAISMAVLTTLYGLLAANLLLAPLSRMVERAAADEEAERQKVLDWLAQQVSIAIPERRSAVPQDDAA